LRKTAFTAGQASSDAGHLENFAASRMNPTSDASGGPRKKIAIAVVEQGGRFLVGQRPPGVPLAGMWEFPGGKVRSGETPEQAAARECLEETGLGVQVGPPYPIVLHDYPHDRVELHFFHCEPLDPDRPPRAPFRWVAAAELANLEFPEANRSLVAELVERHRGSP
jgi:8-oxo-dGTP diphosphatase